MLNKRHIISIMLGVSAVLSPLSAASTHEQSEDSQEALMSYFPEKFVEKTLEKFQIPQAQRFEIKNELTEKDQEVVAIVEEKAAKMSPNPLRDPKHRQEAVKIFRDTLFEVFSQVMQSHVITDKDELKAMLNDIQQQKAQQFAQSVNNYKESENSMNIERSKGSLSRPPRPSYHLDD